MRRRFRYLVWWRICGTIALATIGICLAVAVLYHLLTGVTWMIQSEASNSASPASSGEYALIAGSGLFLILFGVVGLIYTLRAEVVVDPWGITAFGIGMRPSFRAAWSEITEVEMVVGESDFLRIKAGRQKVEVPSGIPDFADLRAIVTANAHC